MAEFLQQPPRQQLIDRIVLGDEDAEHGGCDRRRLLIPLLRPTASAEGGSEVERRAWHHLTALRRSPRAFHPDGPLHQRDELTGDRKTQSGAAVLARRGPIGLLERCED